MSRKPKLAVFFTVVFAMIATPGFPADHLTISITSPLDGADVPWRPCFKGRVSDPRAQVWLVIHVKAGDYYLQAGPISTKENGDWSTVAYIAEDKPTVFEGVLFEAKAYANPKAPLEEGRISGWPDAEAASQLIEIIRRDDAPSGCGGSAGQLAQVRTSPAAGPGAGAATVPAAPDTGTWSRGVFDVSFQALRLPFLLLITLLFAAMAALPARAKEAVDRLEDWCVSFGRSCGAFLPVAWRWFVGQSPRIWKCGHGNASRNWAARGYHGNYRQLALHAALVPLLFTLLLPGLYIEAKSIRAGLSLTFPAVPEARGLARNSESLLASRNVSRRAPSETPAAAVVEFNRSATSAAPQGLLSAVGEVWRGDEYLLMALGLAALEAALGAILFRGMEEANALVISLSALFRARPIIGCVFLALDAVLALLGGIRAYESSPDTVIWFIPTLVGFLLSGVIPWVIGFVFYFAIESLANCLGPFQSLAVCTALIVGATIAQAAWAAVLIAAVVVRFVAFVCFGVFATLAIAYLRLAALAGDLLRWVSARVAGWFPPPWPARS